MDKKPTMTQSQWEYYRKRWGDHARFMFDIVPDPPYFNYDKLGIHDRLSQRFNNYTRNQWNLKHVVPQITRRLELAELIASAYALINQEESE